MRPLLAAALALLLCGCGVARDDQEPQGRAKPSASSAPSAPSDPSPSASPFTPAPAGPRVARGAACAEVRAGIDAFNQQQFPETVAHFVRAVPLAERDADGSRASEELLAAVRYYAGLDATDFPVAARGSAAFAKYKAITLSQCYTEPSGPSDPASPSPSTFDA